MKDREPQTFHGAMTELERAARELFNEVRVALAAAPIIRHILASRKPATWAFFAGCVYVIAVGAALELTGESPAGAILVWMGVVGGGMALIEARERW